MPPILDIVLLIAGAAALFVAVAWAINNVGDKGSKAKSVHAPGAAQLRLERHTQFPEGIEKTRLLINDRPILAASSDGLRLADYSDDVEQLEMLAIKIADALGVSVELARIGGKSEQAEEEVPQMRRLPRNRQDGVAR